MENHANCKHRILMGLLLILLSVFVYALHYAIFRDAHHIFIYFVGDVGFLFIEVLLVTLVLHEMLSERERRSMRKKLNMVIGVFFSEVGTPLLEYVRDLDRSAGVVSADFLIDAKWSHERFEQVRETLSRHECEVNCQAGDLAGLQTFLVGKRACLIRLLENPNLLEHEAFTELLWAVFHLADELAHRPSVANLPEPDYQHLNLDIKRAGTLLRREWLSHMEHLKSDYPYLFSLAVRTNPFDANAAVELA